MAVKMFFLSGETSNISYLHPEIWGNDPQFDEHIFRIRWFNHQLGICLFSFQSLGEERKC